MVTASSLAKLHLHSNREKVWIGRGRMLQAIVARSYTAPCCSCHLQVNKSHLQWNNFSFLNFDSKNTPKFIWKLQKFSIILRCKYIRSRKLRLTTVGDPPRWPRDTPLSAEVDTKISSTSGGRSIGIFRMRTKGHGVKMLGLYKVCELSLKRSLRFLSI
jgi:hypothetical protein